MSEAGAFRYENLFARTSPAPRLRFLERRGKYDFAIAYPDPSSLPLNGLLAGVQEAVAEQGQDLALYLTGHGHRPLREFVAAKLSRDQGIQVTADDLLLTSGAGQAIHVILETLINPGDVVLVDDFTYSGALFQMRRFQADVRGVPTDNEGMFPDALERAIQTAQSEGKAPKLIYVVPNFQNPQGWSMSLERRQAMVALAQKYGIPILEDDCYGDLRYDGARLPPLHTLDESGCVLYVSSFSKTIAPGVRVGYLTAPKEMLERAAMVKSGGAVSLFTAFAIHRYATENLASHIEEINDIQRAKRDAMVAALGEHFNGGATWLKPEGGLSLWVKFPEGTDVIPMRIKVLDEYEVGYVPGVGFNPDGVTGKNYMRLSFGFNTPSEIHEGIGRLAEAFRAEGVLR